MILPDALRYEIISHCVASLPNEGCGLFAREGVMVRRVYPCRNADASANGYTVCPEDHIAALMDAESQGWQVGGSFHSHLNGNTTLSKRDIQGALDPTWVYMVVGLRGEGEIAAWQVLDGQPTKVPV